MVKRKQRKLNQTRKKQVWRRRIFVFIFKAFLCFAITTSAIVFLFSIVNPPTTPLMWIRWVQDGRPIHKPLVLKNWQPLKSISPNLVRAVIAAEDIRFFIHSGIDWKAAWAAFKHNLNSEKKYGASTITMQTARNVFLWQKRNWLRKSLEIYFTLLIESIWTKHRILEVYLNVIEWGDGVFGVSDAVSLYYHRTPEKLSLVEASRMASILPNPRGRSFEFPSKYVINRQSKILKEMKFVWIPPL